uniref:Nucleolar and coiled-body phosphoprotein 1 n=2 Tax=Rhinopithecus TaxID=542827 RepID=A0A2K6KYJ4_RHIBE
MADAGLRRVVPSDLYPLVLGFLRDNQLSEVANKFAKATGATQQDANASSLLDIYSFWLNRSASWEGCSQSIREQQQ